MGFSCGGRTCPAAPSGTAPHGLISAARLSAGRAQAGHRKASACAGATAGQARLAHVCTGARVSLTWPGLAGAMRAPCRTLGRARIGVARRRCNRVRALAQQGQQSWEEWFKWAPVRVMGRGDMLRGLRPAGVSRPSAVRVRMCADRLSLARRGTQDPCSCRAIRSVCSALAYAAPAPAYTISNLVCCPTQAPAVIMPTVACSTRCCCLQAFGSWLIQLRAHQDFFVHCFGMVSISGRRPFACKPGWAQLPVVWAPPAHV